MKTKLPGPLLIGCVLAFSLAAASAIPITYTISGLGTGRLGSDTFSNASFAITSTANTSQIQSLVAGQYRVTDLTTTIFVAGLGLATFITPLTTIDNQTIERGGDRDPSGVAPVLTIENPIFSTYTLATAIGPVDGTAFVGMGNLVGYDTSSGDFMLSSLTDSSFQAVVPDQASTFGVLVLAVLTLDLCRRWPGKFARRVVCLRQAQDIRHTRQAAPN